MTSPRLRMRRNVPTPAEAEPPVPDNVQYLHDFLIQTDPSSRRSRRLGTCLLQLAVDYRITARGFTPPECWWEVTPKMLRINPLKIYMQNFQVREFTALDHTPLVTYRLTTVAKLFARSVEHAISEIAEDIITAARQYGPWNEIRSAQLPVAPAETASPPRTGRSRRTPVDCDGGD